MLPAQQRLRTGDLRCLQIHLGLVEQLEFIVVQGALYLPGVTQLLCRADIADGIVELVRQTVALGAVHCAFGVCQQGILAGAMVWKTRHTQREIDAQLLVRTAERGVKAVQHLGDDTFAGTPGIVDRLQEYTELVTAEARQ